MRLPLATLFLAITALAASAGLWIDVPFVPQTGKLCGAATASMLMRYWADQGCRVPDSGASIKALHKRLSNPGERGAKGSGLDRLLESSGFESYVFRGKYGDLEKHLAAGRPLLVCLDFSRGDLLHFALVVGLDPSNDAVLLNDPARRKLARYDRREFLEAWEAAGFWTLLAVPSDCP